MTVPLIDFILKKKESYYPQVFFKNVNTLKKDKKGIGHVTKDLEISSDVFE